MVQLSKVGFWSMLEQASSSCTPYTEDYHQIPSHKANGKPESGNGLGRFWRGGYVLGRWSKSLEFAVWMALFLAKLVEM
jgi:hypothetical protein